MMIPGLGQNGGGMDLQRAQLGLNGPEFVATLGRHLTLSYLESVARTTGLEPRRNPWKQA
jgi:hypothetical protein